MFATDAPELGPLLAAMNSTLAHTSRPRRVGFHVFVPKGLLKGFQWMEALARLLPAGARVAICEVRSSSTDKLTREDTS